MWNRMTLYIFILLVLKFVGHVCEENCSSNNSACLISFALLKFPWGHSLRLAHLFAELQLQRSQVVLRRWKHRKARGVRATRSCHCWLPVLLPSHCSSDWEDWTKILSGWGNSCSPRCQCCVFSIMGEEINLQSISHHTLFSRYTYTKKGYP